MSASPASQEEQIRNKFRMLDRNKDGTIDFEELTMVLKVLDRTWTDARLQQLFCIVDINSDGKIDYGEFVSWAFGNEAVRAEDLDAFRRAMQDLSFDVEPRLQRGDKEIRRRKMKRYDEERRLAKKAPAEAKKREAEERKKRAAEIAEQLQRSEEEKRQQAVLEAAANRAAKDPTVHASFSVQTMSDTKQVDVLGETLGDLRHDIKQTFGIPRFQQRILYASSTGDPIELAGDDSVLLSEKPGLLDVKELQVLRQVDPRYKMEKEIAFLEALAACRFDEAKEILEDEEGAVIDPNCVHKGVIHDQRGSDTGKCISIGVSECPRSYRHPALTVAMIAGLEYVAHWDKVRVAEIREWMAQEEEVGKVVELLIQKRADVNAVGDEVLDAESAGAPPVTGKSPLCAAVQRGSPFLVRMLLDAKADPNHTVNLGGSAWGPGPGDKTPEAFVNNIGNGRMCARRATDPRNQNRDEILEILRVASDGQ